MQIVIVLVFSGQTSADIIVEFSSNKN